MTSVIEDDLTSDAKDAERFRKLCRLLQSAYDENVFESEMLDVYCRMQSRWRKERTIQADLRWKNKSHGPLDLGAAIDAA